MFVSDDQVAIVGIRQYGLPQLSYLHFECGVSFYQSTMAAKVRDDILRTLKVCQPVELGRAEPCPAPSPGFHQAAASDGAAHVIPPTESSAPVFPSDGRKAGHFLAPPVLSGAGGRQPARRVMDTPHHLCTASSESSAPAFSSGREGGRGVFLMPSVLSSAGVSQPGMAGYEHPISPVYRSNRIQRPGPAESKKTGSP